MSKERNLTELEGCVLGLIGLKGPCTPYVVRKEFLQSPTPYWSGSAGAIYPLIERLSRQKLIEEISSMENVRGGKLYSLTSEGKAVLKRWLYQPTNSMVIGTPPDPLRQRIEFLSFLTSEKRKKFLFEVKMELEEHIKKIINDLEACDQSNYFDYLSTRGVLLAAQARLDWIVEITELLERNKEAEDLTGN